MATYKFTLRTKKGKPQVNRHGQAVIYVQYSHNSKNAYFSTGVKIKPDQYQGDSNQDKPVKDKTPNAKKLNLKAQSIKADITQALLSLSNDGVEPTVQAVRNELNKPEEKADTNEVNLLQLFETFIVDYRPKGKKPAANTIKNYKVCQHRLKEYSGGQPLRPPQITMKFYDSFVDWLGTNVEMNENSIGAIIKNLVVFLKWLEDPDNGYGIIFPVDLRKFKVLYEEREVIYLTQEELESLEGYSFVSNDKKLPYSPTQLEEARDLFVFVCYTGLRVSDLMRVGKQHNIEGDVIRMKAHKTGKPVAVPILPPVRSILEKYNYNLPRIVEQTYNKRIKVACQLAGIDSPVETMVTKQGMKTYPKVPKWQVISSHRAIATFCTHAMERGVPVKQIAEVTGKTIKVLLRRYIGSSTEDTAIRTMYKAYGFEMTVN